ncbi:MAG: glycosyltransferase [Solirubrobacterales bacterium]
MIFLTVGTIFPFDRLVKAVDEAIEANIITVPVFAQIGRADYKPRNMEFVPTLDKPQFDKKVDEATFVISHAGIGSLLIALERNKRLLVVPRMKEHKEVVNDHQLATARHFAELGYVLAAYDCKELPQKLREIESFVPTVRQSQANRVALRLSQFIDQVAAIADRSSAATCGHKHPVPAGTKSLNGSSTR